MTPFDIDKYISEQFISSMGVPASALQSTTSFNVQDIQRLIDSLPKPKTYFYPDKVKEELAKGLGINLDEKDVYYQLI